MQSISTATIISLACGVVAFASFSWGVRGHFVTDGKLPAAMRLLSALSLVTFLWWIGQMLHRPGSAPVLRIVASCLSLCATGLFWWAVAATRRQPPAVAHLTAPLVMVHQHGPYAVIRHPFYLAYILFWTGTILTSGPIGWLLGIVLITWYSVAARKEEYSFAASEVSGVYADYKRRTGLLLPRLPGRGS